MTFNEKFLLVWCYIAVYYAAVAIATHRFLDEFPREKERIKPGMFENIHRSIVYLDLVFHPTRTNDAESWTTRFLFALARALLAFLPVFIIWTATL